MTKQEILEKLLLMKNDNLETSSKKEVEVSVVDYVSLVRSDKNGRKIANCHYVIEELNAKLK